MSASTLTEVQPRPRSVVRRILRGAGWTFITLGVLLLLFVVYELFGTNLITDRAQRGLRNDLEQQLASPPPRELKPIPGQALGILRIPDINLNMAVVEGVSVEDLKKGPGRYPSTALPGHRGNAAIAGHRTTYGKPFWALNAVEKGDPIFVRTREGSFRYEVVWQRVVTPDRSEVLDRTRRPSLTLTTCNPRFSAAERLIIRATLVSDTVEEIEAEAEAA